LSSDTIKSIHQVPNYVNENVITLNESDDFQGQSNPIQDPVRETNKL